MRETWATLGLGIALLAACPLSSAHGGDSFELGTLDETETTHAGSRVVRSTTRGALFAPEARRQSSERRPAGSVGEVLWVDTNHQGAVVHNVAITGNGDHVAIGWWLNNARAALYTTEGVGVPEWTFPINTNFYVPVDASNDGSIVTATGRQDLLYAWDVTSNLPLCVAPHLPGSEGHAAYTPAVGGSFAGSSGFVNAVASTHAHTNPDCIQLFVDPAMTGTVQGGRYAADGDWLAVNTRSTIQVYENQTGSVRGTAPIPGETQATVGVSRDGSILANGGFSATLYVYQWNGTLYEELWTHVIPDITWITAVDVSDDGSTIMVGAWLSPELGRVLVYDVATGPTPLWTNSDFGDYISAVDLNEDGSRGIAGSWGRLEETFGHVIAVFDRANPTPVFAVGDDEIPGVSSCFAVDISNDGTRASAGGKVVHARELGSGGYALALEAATSTTVHEEPDLFTPAGRLVALGQSSPNPLIRSAVIPYALGEPAAVRFSIFDGAGRIVWITNIGSQPAGSHQVVWNRRDTRGRRVPSGVYFYKLEAGSPNGAGRTDSRRLVVLE